MGRKKGFVDRAGDMAGFWGDQAKGIGGAILEEEENLPDDHIWRKISKFLAFLTSLSYIVYFVGAFFGKWGHVKFSGWEDVVFLSLTSIVIYFIAKVIFTYAKVTIPLIIIFSIIFSID